MKTHGKFKFKKKKRKQTIELHVSIILYVTKIIKYYSYFTIEKSPSQFEQSS